MAKYDINDPTDLDIMRAQFDMISHDEWEEYIELAEEQNIGYKNLNIIIVRASDVPIYIESGKVDFGITWQSF